MTAKVENYCIGKRSKLLYVDADVRACVNCIWYEQYYRKNRGNVSSWVATSTGYCLLNDEKRGPMRQPCRSYEREMA